MGDVGSVRYELALLPPYPTIKVSSHSNCPRSTRPVLRVRNFHTTRLYIHILRKLLWYVGKFWQYLVGRGSFWTQERYCSRLLLSAKMANFAISGSIYTLPIFELGRNCCTLYCLVCSMVVIDKMKFSQEKLYVCLICASNSCRIMYNIYC